MITGSVVLAAMARWRQWHGPGRPSDPPIDRHHSTAACVCRAAGMPADERPLPDVDLTEAPRKWVGVTVSATRCDVSPGEGMRQFLSRSGPPGQPSTCGCKSLKSPLWGRVLCKSAD